MSGALMQILTQLDELSPEEQRILKKALEFRLMSPEERAEAAERAFDEVHEAMHQAGWTDEDFDELEAQATMKAKP